MALTSGTKLGPYEIRSPLGAGGTGDVYRARDTGLERTVAVKILPPHLSDNPEARQRFEREARVISSLNHPHTFAPESRATLKYPKGRVADDSSGMWEEREGHFYDKPVTQPLARI